VAERVASRVDPALVAGRRLGAPLRERPASSLSDMLAAHLRGERAIAAAKRFISRDLRHAPELRASDVAEFLERRREKLTADEVKMLASEAMTQWMNSRANRYRGPGRP
jgi:hypothetical protein